MSHHTKDKGDLACAIAIADLSRKGYSVFSPVACEHLPFDLIAYKDNKSHRVQCKYSADGFVKRTTSWADRSGSHSRQYQPGDFDYFAVYVPHAEAVVYPSIRFRGCTINFSIPNTYLPFYWHEDFSELTDQAEKRTYRDFPGADGGDTSGLRNGGPRKVARPTVEELHEMLWAHPTTHIAQRYGVTDNAVAKWAKAYGITKPSRGYWAKQKLSPITTETR